MLTGLAGGALWALDTVILGMALALPVFTGDPRAAILAPFASTFLHDLCSSLWMLGYTGLRRPSAGRTQPSSPHCTRHWARCWHTFS